MLKNKFQMPRERVEWLYSVVVIVAIPLLVVANTVLLTVDVRRNFDSELRYKADLANNLIAGSVKSNLTNQKKLQSQIQQIARDNKELQNISVTVPDNNGFKVVAATDKAKIDQATNDLQLALAASKNQSIAQLITVDNNRYWSVVTPVSENGRVSAIISTDVSLTKEDTLIGNTLMRSLGVVAITVIIIVLLLANHFKFMEYAVLFRKLKEVDQLKNDFLSVATHELRTPMTIIKGNIELLRDGVTGQVDDKGKDVLQKMYNETHRLNELVNDLLNVSRIEEGKISFHFETFDVRDVISEVVANLQNKATEKSMKLEYIKPEQPVFIRVDRGRMIEITTNLVDNAIKYSKQGTVTVSHKNDDKLARISVRDTGIGMSSADRERLFSRFYRIRNENTKTVPGTGLGLWIIKQYIEKMHGKITVDSIEGEGSDFIVEFTLADAPEATAQPDNVSEKPREDKQEPAAQTDETNKAPDETQSTVDKPPENVA